SAKMRDHVADGDGPFARRPVALAAGRMADRWGAQSRAGGERLGFDTGLLFELLDRQGELERAATAGSSVLLVTAPTEEATALALAHTAVLAGRPGNQAPLAEVGRLFGRLAHLLDAVEDLAEDRATGAWNPLVATGTSLAEAERLCRDAVHGIRLALADAEFGDRALVHRLLAHETDAAVRRVFAHATAPGGGVPGAGVPTFPEPFKRPHPLKGCALWTVLCCTCQACCREDYQDPCTGRRRQGPCSDLDCCDACDCDCCEACECCDGCDGCDCCDCGCDCGC
ncbi:hypothetical protein, partial [Streptacidiphilus monticola]